MSRNPFYSFPSMDGVSLRFTYPAEGAAQGASVNRRHLLKFGMPAPLCTGWIALCAVSQNRRYAVIQNSDYPNYAFAPRKPSAADVPGGQAQGGAREAAFKPIEHSRQIVPPAARLPAEVMSDVLFINGIRQGYPAQQAIAALIVRPF